MSLKTQLAKHPLEKVILQILKAVKRVIRKSTMKRIIRNSIQMKGNKGTL